MKVLIVLCGLIVVLSATPTKIEDLKWEQFKSKYGKTYGTVEEENERYSIFMKNLKKIEEHNKLYKQGLTTYTEGVNQFADWTPEEFDKYLRAFPRWQSNADGTFVRPLNVELPSEIDWRTKGAVTDVKDQGCCGSCWAFGAVGGLEGQNYIVNGKLISLSPQELVDCSKEGVNDGCNGGDAKDAFVYVTKNGLTSDQNYPYDGDDEMCRRQDKPALVHITGYKTIASGNEDDLQTAVASIGPITIAAEASNWSSYEGGIYTGACKNTNESLNHNIIIVGYGTESSKDYWIIKNSWGADWGENGYIRLPRHENKCGVALDASYPLVKKELN